MRERFSVIYGLYLATRTDDQEREAHVYVSTEPGACRRMCRLLSDTIHLWTPPRAVFVLPAPTAACSPPMAGVRSCASAGDAQGSLGTQREREPGPDRRFSSALGIAHSCTIAE